MCCPAPLPAHLGPNTPQPAFWPPSRGRATFLVAVPAGFLGTGALTALLVAYILVYLVYSLVPAHTERGELCGVTRTELCF